MPYTLAQINGMSPAQFVEALGWVFEHSPWVAQRARARRPFASADDLLEALIAEMHAATRAEKLQLLRAHPDLGTRAKISDSSTAEQVGAGLDQLTSEEYELLRALNSAYHERFGFPFLYAVKGSDKFAILGALEVRLDSDPDGEFDEALRQVEKIARFRLEGVIRG